MRMDDNGGSHQIASFFVLVQCGFLSYHVDGFCVDRHWLDSLCCFNHENSVGCTLNVVQPELSENEVCPHFLCADEPLTEH